jgi:hypothetical protein
MTTVEILASGVVIFWALFAPSQDKSQASLMQRISGEQPATAEQEAEISPFKVIAIVLFVIPLLFGAIFVATLLSVFIGEGAALLLFAVFGLLLWVLVKSGPVTISRFIRMFFLDGAHCCPISTLSITDIRAWRTP